MTKIDKRSEILFCYDVTDANPNGDPLDGNKPRIDEETKTNIVTDVRLKRTVRDYLFDYKGYNGNEDKDIFVREIESEKGGLQDGKERATNFDSKNSEIIRKCIDIRLFGGVIPLESGDSKTINYTGPIQFKIGRSLNKVELKYIKGTGAFASTAGKSQKTFREEYVLPYSFIAFHGIINEKAAEATNLTEEDVKEFMEALWNGTKNLISRSKFGQMPRFLLKVTYKNPGYFIGDLEKRIKLVEKTSGEDKIKEINDYQIRSTNDFALDISDLVQTLNDPEKIEKVEYCICDTVKPTPNIPHEWKKMTPEWEEMK
jgi:CRISPR-associated protein Csh2